MEKLDYREEKKYLKAKKKVEEIKGFYIHVIVMVLSAPIIIAVNLMFVPGFYFFWLALGGMFLSIIIHWFSVFGFSKLGLGKDWEQKKIKELMDDQNI